jgi:gliding motility-associated-like protein
MAIGSDLDYGVQLIVLTSDGLFVLGTEGTVIDNTITPTSTFQKITVNGKTDGLPSGIQPTDVKMMFASTGMLMLTTCNGEVYVLSADSNLRGDGGVGNEIQWSQVKQNASTPLTNVIVARGNYQVGFALKQDGTLWTWGTNTYLGNGTAVATRNFATQMTLPAGLTGVKMIQATSRFTSDANSYYILGVNKKVYSLGFNSFGQLGDNTSTERTSWVNATNPDNSVIADAAWISANEHDKNHPGVAVIKSGGKLFSAGFNSSYMIGRTINGGINYLDTPIGVTTTDNITFAEVGGHTTALIKQGSPRYGYVGHRVSGSMGDGTSTDQINTSFNFITPPIVAVCGSNPCVQVTLSTNSPICTGGNAIFTITGTVGDVVSYSINNATIQTTTIGLNGTVEVTVFNPLVNQSIYLSLIVGASCSNILSSNATIIIGANVLPTFTQVAAICAGQTLSPLPITSNNGVTGTWSPALNNTQTSTYTFTPNSNCGLTTTMTINVNNNTVLPTFTQLAAICIGQTISPLPTTSNNGITGIWSPALNNAQTITYTFTPDINCGLTTTMTITVNQKVTPTFSQVAAICQGTALANLPTTSNNGIAGTWSPALNNAQTTSYNFAPTTGLCANNTTMTITVNQKVTPTFFQVAAICQGTALADLPTTSNNGIAGTWLPALNNTQTTSYNFAPTTGLCANNTTMTITVNQKVTPTFNTFSALCYKDVAPSLPNVSTNGISGTWLPNVINNTISSNYQFTPNSNQCANQPPIVNYTVYDDFNFEIIRHCVNNRFTLQISPLSNSFDINNASYSWTNSNNSNVSIGNSEFDVTNYLITNGIMPQLPLIYNATVQLPNGCSKTQSASLFSTYCNIQKGISPNNDNLNDFFDLRLMNVKHLSIFNRFGTEVFSQVNYTSQWTGQTNSGQQLPDATYFYVIDFNDEKPVAIGWIYINR